MLQADLVSTFVCLPGARAQPFFGVLLEVGYELLDLPRFDGYSGCHLVTSECVEVLRAGFDRGENTESWYRSG